MNNLENPEILGRGRTEEGVGPTEVKPSETHPTPIQMSSERKSTDFISLLGDDVQVIARDVRFHSKEEKDQAVLTEIAETEPDRVIYLKKDK